MSERFSFWRSLTRWRFWITPLGLFGLSLVLALTARVAVIQDLSSATLNCRWCATPNVFKADTAYLALLMALFSVSLLSASRLWTLLWRIPAVLGLWVYVLDIATMAQFYNRFMLADVRIYLADSRLALGVLEQASWPVVLVLAGLLAISGWWLWQKQLAGAGLRQVLSGASLALVIAVLSYFLPTSDYVHQWALKNVIAANWPTGIDEPYSEQTRQRLSEADQNPFFCSMQPAKPDDIVVLVLESWSPYHSKRWLGLNDWTPRLDALAGQGRWFSRLHAGGFNTNQGLASLLTGRQIVLPLESPTQVEAFDGAWQDPQHSLPNTLAARGYQSAFLTSGDLSYTRKGEWLSHIGFDELHGHDTPAFDGKPRHHFNAVEDAALYDYALSFIDTHQRSKAPQFVVIENVSTHHPYLHPTTGARSEEQVFRYMDDTAADFIEALEQRHFFDHGLLMVVSDHRAMTMVGGDEKQRLGAASASRIPGFILTGNRAQQEVDALYHQADLMPTLLARVSEPPYCQPAAPRSLLANDTNNPACVFHARGDQRDRVDVFCPQGVGTIRVSGDDSRFVNASNLSAERQRRLLDRLAAERL